jgi:hypothetical protein
MSSECQQKQARFERAVLKRTRSLLERVAATKKHVTLVVRRKLNEGDDIGSSPEKLEKLHWLLTNKFLPLILKARDLQRDVEMMDTPELRNWGLQPPSFTNVEEESEELTESLKYEGDIVQKLSWEEGLNAPAPKILGRPLELTSYIVGRRMTGRERMEFIKWVEDRHHSNDFVWGRIDKSKQQTIVIVMKNPSAEGIQIDEVRTRKTVVSEAVQDALGDDYQEVRPSPNLSRRAYLAKGKPKYYRPKDVLTLIWKYESTPEAKKQKEIELTKKYPNKTLHWMEIPYLSVATIE